MRILNDIYHRCNHCVLELQYFEEAIKQEAWKKAMKEEIVVIEKNNTGEVVDIPQNKGIVSIKWIHKMKYNAECKNTRQLISVYS